MVVKPYRADDGVSKEKGILDNESKRPGESETESNIVKTRRRAGSLSATSTITAQAPPSPAWNYYMNTITMSSDNEYSRQHYE